MAEEPIMAALSGHFYTKTSMKLAVCGYDSDVLDLGCPVMLYGQDLQGVLGHADWTTEIEQKSDYQLGVLSASDSEPFLRIPLRAAFSRRPRRPRP